MVKKEIYKLEVKIILPAGLLVDKEYKKLKEDCRNTKVPDGGFLNKDLDIEAIHKIKISKSIYRKITDLYELVKRQKARVTKTEFFYNQIGYPSNYAIYTISFRKLEDKVLFSKIFFK